MTMLNIARLTFDFEVRCAIIGTLTPHIMQLDQFVDRLEISVQRRSFKIYGSNAEIKEIFCNSIDQFLNVLEMSKIATEIDKEIKVVYV